MDFAGKATNITVEGVIEKFTNKYIKQDVKTKSERTQKAVMPFITEGSCPSCRGARLSQTTLSCKINGLHIAEMSAMEVGRLIRVIREIDDPIAAPIIKSLTERLQHLVDIGGLLDAGPRDGYLVRRRVAARQNGQTSERQPGGCHLHLR